MKLVVKLPPGKPPFIGIVLPQWGDPTYPQKLNEDLVNEHKYASYRIELEYVKNKLNLRLISDESVITRHYNGLEFNSQKLTDWLYLTKDVKQFNFGHVVFENNKETVAKTWSRKKLFVLQISKCELTAY